MQFKLSGVDTSLLKLYALSSFASLSYVVFGLDTGSVGSLTTMPQFEETFGLLKEIERGSLVASILAASALSGFFAGRLADTISRKYTISIGAFIFAVGELICCLSPSMPVLIAGRVIAGLGEGLFLSVASTWIAEISPSAYRGRLCSVMAIAVTLGICLGYFICYGSVKISSSLSWRLPFAIQTVLALVLAIGSPFLPYSPRYLISRGKYEQARQVLDHLNKPGAEAEKEEILALVQEKEAQNFARIFKKDVLATTLWSAWIQSSQQLSGIDFVLYFAPLLFTQAGLDASSASFIASGVTGIVLLVSTMCALPFMDKISRKKAIVYGAFVIGFALLLIGILYASGASQTAGGKWTIIALIEVYAIAFSTTWALHVRIYTTEIHPHYTRAPASSFGIAINQATNFMVALTAPAFLAASSYGPYFTFGSVMIVTGVLCLLIMNDTRGLSLEAIGHQSSQSSPLSKLLSIIRRRAGVASQMPLESRNSIELSPVQSIAQPSPLHLDDLHTDDPMAQVNLRERRQSRPSSLAPFALTTPQATETSPADSDLERHNTHSSGRLSIH